MDPKEIDSLFREKLHNHQVTPLENSWLEVEKQVGSKRDHKKFYWLAASITLVAVLFVWLESSKRTAPDQSFVVSKIDFPSTAPLFHWELREIMRVNEPQKELPNKTNGTFSSQVASTKTAWPNQKDSKIKSEVFTLDLKSKRPLAQTSLENPKLIELSDSDLDSETIKLPQIKITYIASATPKEAIQEADSAKGFRKLLSFAGKLSPGGVLSDIRAAKDDFISNGFRSKEKEESSL